MDFQQPSNGVRPLRWPDNMGGLLSEKDIRLELCDCLLSLQC